MPCKMHLLMRSQVTCHFVTDKQVNSMTVLLDTIWFKKILVYSLKLFAVSYLLFMFDLYESVIL